jgi:GT2 family glycosyltransferase
MVDRNKPVDVSVIIVNWNTRKYLETCLQSIGASTRSSSLEVIVVDNNSSDGSIEMVQQGFPEVKLLCNSSNRGFAAANNQGIHASSGRYLCLINSDVRVLSGCLDALVAFMNNHPEIAIAGPRVLNGDLTLQSSCRRFPNLWNNFCETFALPRLFPRSRFLAGEHMTFFQHDRMIFPDVLVGCFLIVRRAAVKDFGLLDENFFMYAEDVDWCLRCWQAGWKTAFFPGAEAVHFRGGSSSNDPVRLAVALQHARQQFWRKHYTFGARLGLAGLLALENTMRWVANALSAMLKIKQRAETLNRMQRNAACVKALFDRSQI